MSSNASNSPNAGSLVLEIGANDDRMQATIDECTKRLEKFEAMYAGFTQNLDRMAQQTAAAESLAAETAAEKARSDANQASLEKIEAAERNLAEIREKERRAGLTETQRKLEAVDDEIAAKRELLESLVEELELREQSVGLSEEEIAKLADAREQLMALESERGKRHTDIHAKLALEEAEKTEKQAEEKRKRAAGRYKDFAVTVAATTYNIQTYIVAPLKGMLQGFSGVGDTLDKMTRRAQVGVERLTALGFAAEQNGAKMEDVASAFAHLNGMMDRARRGDTGAQTDILKGSGLFYADLKKLPVEEQLLKVTDVIAQVGHAADRAEIARRMFGSGGEALLPMLEKGREGIAALTAEADKLGIPLSRKDVETSRNLAREMSKLQAVASGIRDTLVTKLSGPAGEFLQWGQRMLRTVRGFIDANPALVRTLAAAAVTVAGVTTAVTLGIPVFSAFGATLTSVMGAVKAAGGVLTLFATPWLAIPAAIAGAVYALVRFTAAGQHAFAAVKGWAAGALNGLADFFGDAVKLIMQGDFSGAFENLWLRCEKIFIQGVAAIQNQFQSVLEITKMYLGPLWEYATEIFGSLWDTVREYTAGAANWLSETWQTLFANAKSVFGKLWDTLAEGWAALGDEIGADQSNLGDNLITGWYAIQKGILGVWYSLRETWIKTVGSIQKRWDDFSTYISKKWNKIRGYVLGENKETIAAANKKLDAENAARKDTVNAQRRASLETNEAEKKMALEGLRQSTKAGLAKAKTVRDRRTLDTGARVEEINQALDAARKRLTVEMKTPMETELATAMGTAANTDSTLDKAPPWMQEHQQTGQSVTLNAFQAAAGQGDTDAVRLRKINEEIRDILRDLLEKAGW